MTDEQKAALLDLAAFAKWAAENPDAITFTGALGTIGHDIRGLFDEDDKMFLPRTSGYAERMAKA